MQENFVTFIDVANFNQSVDWTIDYQKLKNYLEENFGKNKGIYYFDIKRSEQELLLEKNKNKTREDILKAIKQQSKFNSFLSQNGLIIISKVPKITKDSIKANIDPELTYYLTKIGPLFDNIILCSGDSDYHLITKDLIMNGKNVINITSRRSASYELKNYSSKFICLDDIKDKIEHISKYK